MKNNANILAIIGVISICILSFIIPDNPYKTVPALTLITLDKPLWFVYSIGFSFIYLIVLYTIDEIIFKK